MAISQEHGTIFENHFKLSGHVPGAEKWIGKNHLRHDLPKELDPERELPGSIKTINNPAGTLYLADACRFIETIQDKGMRKFVGIYEQGESTKSFHTVYEFLLLPEHHSWLFGSVDLDDVKLVKDMINLRDIPLEAADRRGYEAGKGAANAAVDLLRKKRGKGIVQFNPKIGRGSGHERRLQASVKLDLLWEKLKTQPGSACHVQRIGMIGLPLNLSSTRRVNAGRRGL